MKLSIVIPCYNEADSIPKLLSAYAEVISRSDIEVILVDNGSTDNTAEVLMQLLPIYVSFLKVVTIPINEGYGHGVLTGLKTAKGEFIGWTHGDLQTLPKDVLSALSIIEQNGSKPNLFIKGTRTGRPLFDRIFTFGMSVFETIYLQTNMTDINAQPNIFHRSFFTSWKNPPTDFSLDLYVLYLARKQNLNIIRFAAPFLKRQHGTSKWNTGILGKNKFIKRTFKFSIELKRRLKEEL